MTVPVPPLCARGQFCPDEGSGCRALAAVGTPCQAGRDEQCAPPGDWAELAGGLNVNGSVCLKSVCMYVDQGMIGCAVGGELTETSG